jgi:hypothetical protein
MSSLLYNLERDRTVIPDLAEDVIPSLFGIFTTGEGTLGEGFERRDRDRKTAP